MPLTGDLPSGVYWRPEGKEYLAGSPNSKFDSPDLEPEWDDFESLVWPALANRVPEFEQLKLTGGWAGYYDCNTLDNNAIVGKHPKYENVFMATGFTGRGLYEFNDHHDKILPLLRFQTSESEDLISLDDYLKKMKSDQKEIYYFANTDKDHIKNSPQLEGFIANKIPVLFMTDAVDEFWLQNIQKFKEKEFKSITKGKVDLSKLKKTSDKKDNINKNVTKINDLINVLKKELEAKISNVIISDRLTKSPILLVADETSMDINMEKLMKMHNKKTQDSKKILEINPDHPMIIKLSETLTKVDHKKLSNLLLDQANILDGNVLSNPTNYIESLTDLFIKP